MREIVVRAWDKKHNRMIGPWSLLDFPSIDEDGIITSHKWEGGASGKLVKTLSQIDDLGWMERTSSCDKDAKAIYEGDIVRNDDTFAGDTTISIFTVQVEGDEFFLESHEDQEYNSSINIDPLEVIGNIYANPELMGEA